MASLEQSPCSVKDEASTVVQSMGPSRTEIWRERVHNFSWQWHVIVMATGVCSSLVHNFPYRNDSFILDVIALALFILDLCLFALLCIWAITRCVMFPQDKGLLFTDPAASLFIGFFTNGAATLINAGLSVNRDWGMGRLPFLYTLWGLWWLDCCFSCTIACWLVYLMIGQNYNDLQKVRPMWMVPVITLITISTSGGLFTHSLLEHSRTMALISLSVSVTLLGIGLSFTMMLTTAFLLRLYLHGPLDATIVLSTFTTLTPLGQGGFSMLTNGQTIETLFSTSSALHGTIVYTVCICGAYLLWSMGLAWIAVACFSVRRRASSLPRFSISHWCVVVPNGVFAALSLQLAAVLDSAFLRAFGAVWACIVFAMWVFVFGRSVPAIWDGSMFKPPPKSTPPKVVDVEVKAVEVEVVLPQAHDVESVVETLCSDDERKMP